MQETTVLTRSFISKGRRNKRPSGNIRLREHYLRDDLEETALKLIGSGKRSDKQLQLSWAASHFIIPDWEVLLQYLELFESSDMSVSDAIFLETALRVFKYEATSRQEEKLKILVQESNLR
jgi:hypothetical protein